MIIRLSSIVENKNPISRDYKVTKFKKLHSKGTNYLKFKGSIVE